MNQQQIDDMNSQFGATSKQRQSEVEQVMQQQLRHQQQVKPPPGNVRGHSGLYMQAVEVTNALHPALLLQVQKQLEQPPRDVNLTEQEDFLLPGCCGVGCGQGPLDLAMEVRRGIGDRGLEHSAPPREGVL